MHVRFGEVQVPETLDEVACKREAIAGDLAAQKQWQRRAQPIVAVEDVRPGVEVVRILELGEEIRTGDDGAAELRPDAPRGATDLATRLETRLYLVEYLLPPLREFVSDGNRVEAKEDAAEVLDPTDRAADDSPLMLAFWAEPRRRRYTSLMVSTRICDRGGSR